MDIATESMVCSKRTRNLYQLFHRVVGILDDSGTKEESLNVVPLVEFDRERHDLVRCEACARYVARNAIHAIRAVVHTVVRQKNFQERHTASVGRVAVADAYAGSVSETALRPLPKGTAARARGIVFCSICEDSELRFDVHTNERTKGESSCILSYWSNAVAADTSVIGTNEAPRFEEASDLFLCLDVLR